MNETAIRSMIDQDQIGWDGELRRDSLLLRLGDLLHPMASDPPEVVDLADQDAIDRMYDEPVTGWHEYRLERGRLVLFHTHQPVSLPRSVGGLIGGLSHMARLGLTVHLDTPIVDAGFQGVITMEMFNAGPSDVILRPGMPVAKVLLHRLGDSTTPETPEALFHHRFYGAENHLGSKYAAEFYADADHN